MGGLDKQIMSIPTPNDFTIGERIPGIVNKMGKSSGIEQNWGYHAKDDKGQECVLIYCNPGSYTIIDKEYLQRIRIVNDKQISWFIGVNGYAACRTIVNDKDSVLTLHQFITNHYGHGKGQSSVDHINRNKLDNRSANLRITTQSVQNENRDKVKRHKTAKNLPDEIKDEILPKFVVYYKEKISKDTYREFFTVEGHPLQKQKDDNIVNDQTNQLNSRRWATTKSNRVSIVDKLNLAKLYVIELDLLYENPLYKIQDINTPTINLPRMNGLKRLTEQKEETKEKQQEQKERKEETKEKQQEQKERKEETKEKKLKQWKVAQIQKVILENRENEYKEFCEQNNGEIPDWNIKWATFVLSVKSAKEPEKTIRDFIEDLRRIRHNELCYNKNAKIVDREDREQWPSTTVLRAYEEGKINQFKEFQEKYTGDKPEDVFWKNKWAKFMEDLKGDNKIDIIKKFMTAQRTRVYRAKKKHLDFHIQK